MAVRYTVYCKRSAAEVTPEQLLGGLREADLHTIAENDDVPDDIAEEAVRQLRVERVTPDGFGFYRLCYRPDGMRQIDIERWQTEGEVRSVALEVLEDLAAARCPQLAKIQPHLEQTIDIIDLSFGSSGGEEMATILASESARWLAERCHGIIRAADDSWWELGQRYHEYQPLQ
jgi:hypothetical protein